MSTDSKKFNVLLCTPLLKFYLILIFETPEGGGP